MVKCQICGKNASFLSGGAKHRGKDLCRECFDKVIEAKNGGLVDPLETLQLEAEDWAESDLWQPQFLRILSWVILGFSCFFAFYIWSDDKGFYTGMKPLLIGLATFGVLNILCVITENLVAIRKKLESK